MCSNHPERVHEQGVQGMVREGSMCSNHPELVHKHPAPCFPCRDVVREGSVQLNSTLHTLLSRPSPPRPPLRYCAHVLGASSTT